MAILFLTMVIDSLKQITSKNYFINLRLQCQSKWRIKYFIAIFNL